MFVLKSRWLKVFEYSENILQSEVTVSIFGLNCSEVFTKDLISSSERLWKSQIEPSQFMLFYAKKNYIMNFLFLHSEFLLGFKNEAVMIKTPGK